MNEKMDKFLLIFVRVVLLVGLAILLSGLLFELSKLGA